MGQPRFAVRIQRRLAPLRPQSLVESILHLIGICALIVAVLDLVMLARSQTDQEQWEHIIFSIYSLAIGAPTMAMAIAHRRAASPVVRRFIRLGTIGIVVSGFVLQYSIRPDQPVILSSLLIMTTFFMLFLIESSYRYLISMYYFIINTLIIISLALQSKPLDTAILSNGDAAFFLIVQVVTIIFTVLFIRDATKKAAELARSRAEREQEQRLRQQAEELAALRERNRIARDIHDGLGHYLTSISIQASALRAGGPATGETLAQIEQLSKDGLAEIRRSISALRGEQARDLSLPGKLRELAEQISADGIASRLKVFGDRRQLPPHIEQALFRVAQEALTNSRKHARAGEAGITLTYARDSVALDIADNGAGAASTATGGYGLLGMAERAKSLGGSCQIDTAPGAGFHITVEVPV